MTIDKQALKWNTSYTLHELAVRHNKSIDTLGDSIDSINSSVDTGAVQRETDRAKSAEAALVPNPNLIHDSATLGEVRSQSLVAGYRLVDGPDGITTLRIDGVSWIGPYVSLGTLQAGTTYTWSMDVRQSDIVKYGVRPTLRYYNPHGTQDPLLQYKNTEYRPGQRLSHTFVASVTAEYRLFLEGYCEANEWVELSRPKLELGSVATPWVPHVSDYASSKLVVPVTPSTDGLMSSSDKGKLDTVSRGAEPNVKPNLIPGTLEVGGRGWVRNSQNTSISTGFEDGHACLILDKTQANSAIPSVVLRISNNITGDLSKRLPDLVLRPNTQYTISLKCKLDDDFTFSNTYQILYGNINAYNKVTGTSRRIGLPVMTDELGNSSGILTANQWHTLSSHFTTLPDPEQCVIVPYVWSAPNTGHIYHRVYICDYKLEEGDHVTPWVPHVTDGLLRPRDQMLSDHIVMFAGDSRFFPVTDSKSMATRFAEYSGATTIDVVANDATTARSSHGSSVVGQVKGYDTNADIQPDTVVIAGSINDASYGVPLGVHSAPGSEHDENTYLGAVESIIEYINTNWPDARILWVRDNMVNKPVSISLDDYNAVISKARQYQSELGKVADDYGLEWVDFRVPQLNGRLKASRDTYFTNAVDPGMPGYSGDGIHPNREGHMVMARIIADMLK